MRLWSSDGFSYCRGVKSGNRQYWRCHVRNKTMKCPASVKQFGDMFSPGLGGHCHPADPGIRKKVKMTKLVTEVAKDRLYEPANQIVERVLIDWTTENDVNVPRPANLERTANRYRHMRPDDPTDLHFKLDRVFAGGNFVIDDIQVDGARHLVFGTAKQLEYLRQATRWFLDGTFKITKDPFKQLYSVHCFVKKGDDEKQVPLAYILMSRRSKEDYKLVLTSLRHRLGVPSVEWFMLDFEPAVWQAIREVFPGTVVKGCVFHLQQRIFKKIQRVGLQQAYCERGDKYTYLRKLMALPYLPVEQIVPAYDRLKDVASEVGGAIQEVANYMERTWVCGSVWQPANWCVFREMVRTNNDLEGWHGRINSRAGNPNLGLYKLVTIIRGEADAVKMQIRMVSQNLLCKIRRKKYVNLHGRLQDSWDQYEEEEEISTTELLRRVSQIAGLGPTTAAHHIFDDDE